MTQDSATRPHAERPSRRVVGGRDLVVATLVGVVLAVAVVAALLVDPWIFVAAVALVTAVAFVEVRRVLRRVGRVFDAPVAIVATWVMLLGAVEARHAGQVIGLLVLLLGAAVWQLLDTSRDDVVAAMSTTVWLGLWVGLPASFAVLLASADEFGPSAVLIVLAAAALGDTGAFAVGVAVGRHPIAPSVSPNKTWEGFLGGLVIAAGVAAIVVPLLTDLLSMRDAAIVAALCAGAAFIGDLVESMVKRDLGVKDLGVVLPGHGGVLDRIDGILFALPVGFFALELLR
ncbi:MAG: phosphatidate cytidylyltransferase [Nitriliruptoraceae bacterium]